MQNLRVGVLLAVLVGCSFFDKSRREDVQENASSVAPPDSMWPNGHAAVARPEGKGAGTTWAQGCTGNASAAPGADSYVTMWWMELRGKTTNGTDQLLVRVDYSTARVEGEYLYRGAKWGISVPGLALAYRRADGTAVFPVGDHPEYLSHWWLPSLDANTWRIALPPDIVTIWGEAEIQCFGDARFQMGADWWTSVNSPPGTQTEAHASRWYSAADGRIVIR